MKKALIAVDPSESTDQNPGNFHAMIKLFQSKGLFDETVLVSVIHPDLYVTPSQWFRDMKGKLAKQALGNIEKKMKGCFPFSSIKVLTAESDSLESLVAIVARYGRRLGSDVLVLASNDRSGLPLWFLGSFSETAALTASLPILVIKPDFPVQELSHEARILVSVDVSVPIPAKTLRWIADTAKSLAATIDLVFVKPRPRLFLDALTSTKSAKDPQLILQNIQEKFQKWGIRANIATLDERISIAHTLVEFAEQHQAWMIMTLSVKRSNLRKLLLGSNSRHILALTRRPFLSLRSD